MRTIKFRGKDRRSGKWFYGNYYDKDSSGRTHICNCSRGSLDVLPETVGQFTGLYDKNDNEIYEGDILIWGEGENKSRPLIVFFKHGAFGYIYSENWFHSFAGNTNFSFNPLNKDIRFEVIGNIHDHPELLKGECK